jgi:hypothetical protein
LLELGQDRAPVIPNLSSTELRHHGQSRLSLLSRERSQCLRAYIAERSHGHYYACNTHRTRGDKVCANRYQGRAQLHRFQGREAEAVFLVLGAPDALQTGARNWAGHPPNLVNVAVSRAKEVLYVVGNRELWRTHGSFRAVNDGLPI